MKKTAFAWVAALGLSTLFMSGCHGHRPGKTAFALEYVNEVLDLTAAQEEKLNAIKDELLSDFGQVRKDKKEIYSVLKEQIARESIDRDAVRQLVADHQARKYTIIERAVDKLVDFHGKLTPEQRAKLVAKLEKFEKHHR